MLKLMVFKVALAIVNCFPYNGRNGIVLYQTINSQILITLYKENHKFVLICYQIR